MTGFSIAPLQLFSVLGMLVAAGSVLLYLVVMVERMLLADNLHEALAALWDRDILAFFLIGLQLFGIGLLGEYIGRIYEQVRQRPRYIVSARARARGMTRAVVFGYHDVGVRCLAVLLAQRVEVPLVVTHRDAPGENLWFASVAELAAERDLDIAFPEDPNASAFAARVAALRPDFVFSFYYRHMLGERLLAAPHRGALNMHGSLLPKYRGRAPVNWAVIMGETETGATPALHDRQARRRRDRRPAARCRSCPTTRRARCSTR